MTYVEVVKDGVLRRLVIPVAVIHQGADAIHKYIADPPEGAEWVEPLSRGGETIETVLVLQSQDESDATETGSDYESPALEEE